MKIKNVVTRIDLTINDIERDALIKLLSNERIRCWCVTDRMILENILDGLEKTKDEYKKE